MMKLIKNHKWMRTLMIILWWMLVWQTFVIIVDNQILLVGPIETMTAVIEEIITWRFWKTILFSFTRISIGFFAGSLVGVLLALCSSKYKMVEEMISPIVSLIRAIPVVSFVVLFLIWWGSSSLSIVISFCVVFPMIYANTLEGIKSTDKKLLEMAFVYQMPKWNQIMYIYRPALRPFLYGGIKAAVGMSWKSGVAAEVIGMPDFSIGERIYRSKIFLETADILAWTMVIIFLSFVFEKITLYLWEAFQKWEPKPVYRRKYCENTEDIKVEHVGKIFNNKEVIYNKSEIFEKGKLYYFKTPSGSGKTTLFRIIVGLETIDQGAIDRNRNRFTMVFQEDRLCEEFSPIRNLELVMEIGESPKESLMTLLNEEDLHKPCKFLSGGMKRRVAIVRALASKSDVVILDEPYTGLDKENCQKVYQYILNHQRGRTILIATHINIDENL